ncbi:MAG: hypothetical protein AAGB46_17325, partial [Verrucomicrobiota bacterium]
MNKIVFALVPAIAAALNSGVASSREKAQPFQCSSDYAVGIFSTDEALPNPSLIETTYDRSLFATRSLPNDAGNIVTRCFDDDFDGKIDRTVDFLRTDQLITGLTFDGEWLYTSSAEGIKAHRDRNSDGVADQTKVILASSGPDPIQFLNTSSNRLSLGVDGFLYLRAGDDGLGKVVSADGSKIQVNAAALLRVRTDGAHLSILHWGYQKSKFDPRDPQRAIAQIEDAQSIRVCNGELIALDIDSTSISRYGLVSRTPSFQTEGKTAILKATHIIDFDQDIDGNLFATVLTQSGSSIFKLERIGKPPAENPPLAKMGNNALCTLLESESAEIRLAAQTEILRRDFPAIPKAEEIIENPAATIDARATALQTLIRLHGRFAIPLVSSYAADPEIGPAAIAALGSPDIAHRVNPHTFLSALKSPDPRMRFEAADAMSRSS